MWIQEDFEKLCQADLSQICPLLHHGELKRRQTIQTHNYLQRQKNGNKYRGSER